MTRDTFIMDDIDITNYADDIDGQTDRQTTIYCCRRYRWS